MREIDTPCIVTDQEPLLSCPNGESAAKKMWVLVRWVLKISMWAVFVSWIILLFLLPVEWFYMGYHDWFKAGDASLFGVEGRAFLVYSSPVVILAILSTAYQIILQVGDEEEHLPPRSEEASYRLWTFPVMVDGPLGVVSAAELVGIIIFFVFIFWSLIQYKITIAQKEASTAAGNTRFLLFYSTGIGLGSVGVFTMAFLFLPVARGSALLRLVNVPFEHATKYHIWLGNVTLLLLTLHGIFMPLAYAAKGDFKGIFGWENDRIANLPGVIALVIGFLMWITSIKPVRRKYFEPFFYTHQLYILFLIFAAFHVGEFFLCMTIGMIFIFMLDRFLRLCQSRTIIDVVSTKYHPCGIVELALPKPADLRYNALSLIFLQIREVSWLQWHPFSISTSPLDGKNNLSVMIKVGGEWTLKLKEEVSSMNMLTASVEGPYGYELPYYMKYVRVFGIVAGGIGISPFLAILRDILHRTAQAKPCRPRNILIIWAVKKSNELPIYFKINDELESICSSFSNELSLEARVYITQETEPALEEGGGDNDSFVSLTTSRTSNGRNISNLVGTGNSKWLAAYVLSSTIGFLIIKGLLEKYYINAMDVGAWWYLDILLVACMVAGVVLFGGLVVGLWHLRESKIEADRERYTSDHHQEEETSLCKVVDRNKDLFLRENASVVYGSRPDLRGVFESLIGKWGNVDVGAIVCGPSSMESSVAKACRTLNVARRKQHPIFHFHTHSFSI